MSTSRPARLLEAGLFAARWLLAPFYIGLVIALVALLGVFLVDLPREIEHLLHTPPARLAEAGILMALSLIDLSLAADLLLIVILAGYENFVSRIHAAPETERPAWMGTIDFSGLKMKLIASIVAISTIALLRTYLELGDHPPDQATLLWEVAITLTFVVAGVLLALMDFIISRTDAALGSGAAALARARRAQKGLTAESAEKPRRAQRSPSPRFSALSAVRFFRQGAKLSRPKHKRGQAFPPDPMGRVMRPVRRARVTPPRGSPLAAPSTSASACARPGSRPGGAAGRGTARP